MTRKQYEKRLAELEAEADKRGCCVIPAKPLREPSTKHQTPKASKAPARASARKHQAPARRAK